MSATSLGDAPPVPAPSGPAAAARRGPARGPWRPAGWNTVGLVMVLPFVLVFAVFVVYPVSYGFWLAHDPANYRRLLDDPIFTGAVVNTLIFLLVAINLKMAIALALSGFFMKDRWWIRAMAVLFILPWAVPSIPTILSFRFMFNTEWGVVNTLIFRLTQQDGPNWLNDPTIAFGMAMLVHIWKSLPFWTLILLSGRLAIPKDMYEAAAVDGATGAQQFRHITWPSMKQLYLTCTLLSMIWTLGDFNSVYLLTGGGPADLTHVLATLGIRYLRLDNIELSMATVVFAMPFVLPLVYFMIRRLSVSGDEHAS
ncbi:MAG: carbohydrate ABC transporter permease [Lautropia sp.]